MIGVPFLTFNNNVVVYGPRNLWSLHTAYYYGRLMLLGEWQSGFQDYALRNATNAGCACRSRASTCRRRTS